MPSGSLIEYVGARGTVFRVKYRDAGGRQVMETIGAARDGVTRKQAEAELRERLVRVERHAYRRPQRVTFAEYADAWLDAGPARRGWKPGTPIRYRPVLVRLKKAFGPMPLGAVRPSQISGYVTEMLGDYAAKTVNLDISVLHDIFKCAAAEELVTVNPASGVERPRVKRRKWRILKPEEVTRVAQAFTDDQARLIFVTLMLTGMRRHELLDLRWRDVDLIANVLRVVEAKTESGERAIALPPMLSEALWQHRRASAYQGDGERVFCHPERGSAIDKDVYAAAFRKALTAAGISDYVRPFHDLRHASLTNGVVSGEQPLEVMARAGHRSMSTTRHYLHLAGVTFPEKAAALERHLLGGRTFYQPEMTSDDLASPDTAVDAVPAPA